MPPCAESPLLNVPRRAMPNLRAPPAELPSPARRNAPSRPSCQFETARPSAHGGSASHSKGPAGQASPYHVLAESQALPAGRPAIFLRVRHRDTRGNGERRVEVPAQREFLSLESNLLLAVSFLCTPALRVVLTLNPRSRPTTLSKFEHLRKRRRGACLLV